MISNVFQFFAGKNFNAVYQRRFFSVGFGQENFFKPGGFGIFTKDKTPFIGRIFPVQSQLAQKNFPFRFKNICLEASK